MKTKKALKGRFKVTASGKILRRKQNRSHILSKKSSKRKRHLGKPALVSEGYRKLYKQLMGA